MRILGLDVSTVSTGWAVCDDTAHPGQPDLIDYDTLQYSYDTPFRDRLVLFREMLIGILDKHLNLDYVLIEDTYISMNPKTTKQLNRFAGVAMESIASKVVATKIICVPAVSIRSALYPGKKVEKEFIKLEMIKRFKLMSEEDMADPKKLKKYCNDITDAIAASLTPYYRRVEDKWII